MIYACKSLLEKRDASCGFILCELLELWVGSSVYFFCNIGIKPKALNMLGRYHIMEVHLQSLSWGLVI